MIESHCDRCNKNLGRAGPKATNVWCMIHGTGIQSDRKYDQGGLDLLDCKLDICEECVAKIKHILFQACQKACQAVMPSILREPLS